MQKTALSLALAATLFVAAPIATAGQPGPAGASLSSSANLPAAQGDPVALLAAGKRHLAEGDPRSVAMGVGYLQRVIRMGGTQSVYANTALGDYYGGLGDPASMTLSGQHYRTAAIAGDTDAQTKLARQLVDKGKHNPTFASEAYQQAMALWTHAANNGNTQAAWELGCAYYYGVVTAVDASQGREWMLRAADQGHGKAAYSLASDAMRNPGSSSFDPDFAKRYLTIAANAGNTQAMLDLASGYVAGQPWPQDLDQAQHWAQLAKSAGNKGAVAVQSQIRQAKNSITKQQARTRSVASASANTRPNINAPVQLDSGAPMRPDLSGSPADQLAALTQWSNQLLQTNQRLRQRLASADMRLDRIEQRLSGHMPTSLAAEPVVDPVVLASELNQQGLAAFRAGDYRRAIRLFASAQRDGNVDAANNLGMIYLQGQGTQRDIAKAVDLFRQAAYAGHATASRNLGYIYEHGLGVVRDTNRAMVWYTRARQTGRVASQPQVEYRLAGSAASPAYY